MSIGVTGKVSIVIPSYNVQPFIGETLASVSNQSISEWEVIVVDDCSTDDTCDVVRKWCQKDSRIKLITLDKNFGSPAGPRNIGVQEATGEWVAFLDADDIWHPRKLEIQLSVLNKTGAKLCSSQVRDFHSERDLRVSDQSASKVKYLSFLAQLIKNRTPTSSVVIARSAICKTPFNEDIRYKAREDFDCWLRCHEEFGRSVKVMSPLVGYRISCGQISGDKIAMVKRHLYVLRNYRLKSGRRLSSAEAGLYTITHFLLGLFLRRLTKGL